MPLLTGESKATLFAMASYPTRKKTWQMSRVSLSVGCWSVAHWRGD